ncbi:hypothetical protein ACFPES_18635 [Paenibacillus sp. GCM10023248]|uniref:hypothetical protein n=1 Tax=Bacillales TaxID=1385 RepID=UPI0023795FB8|nr:MULTISPECIES: hypothetical protein [Bacillales]MDD9269065.1 hypothetical protein [Paenibacillus sp. MAHUQ-63]MDR6880714.1 hypothetical protein [Bacillus sp. 3255]
MLERIIILLIITAQLLSADFGKLQKASRRETIVYTAATLAAGYLAFLFIFGKDWFNFNDLLNLVFSAPAHKIVEYLKAPS